MYIFARVRLIVLLLAEILSSSWKTLILTQKSSFSVNMSACECVCVGAATRWSRHRCHSGSCCVCSGNGRCFGPRSLPLFLLPLPRQICQGRSVCGWRVGWRGGDREALIRISMWKEGPKRIISEGMLGYQTSECGVTIFNRAYNSVSSLVMH